LKTEAPWNTGPSAFADGDVVLEGKALLRAPLAASNMPLLLAARMRASYAKELPPRGRGGDPRERARRDPQKEGAGNAGCPMHPQPRARMVVVNAHEYSQRVHRNRPAFPHAMVLTVYFVLSPAIGPFAAVASRIKVLPGPVEPNEPPRDLTPASRRQDHTTSPSADSRLCQSPRRGLSRRSLSEGRRNSAVVLRA
jgi:hypothetical protein